jgi:hypothetical protein
VRPDQAKQAGAGLDDLFEIVHNEQELAVCRPGSERLLQRLAGLFCDAEPDDGGQDECGSRTADSSTTVTFAKNAGFRGHREREPRLTASAGSDESHETNVREGRVAEVAYLSFRGRPAT